MNYEPYVYLPTEDFVMFIVHRFFYLSCHNQIGMLFAMNVCQCRKLTHACSYLSMNNLNYDDKLSATCCMRARIMNKMFV